MVTVLRVLGLDVVINTDDHLPAHVHVFYGDGEAKINLRSADNAPELDWDVGMKGGDVRHILKVVGEHQEALLAWWSKIHG